MPHPRSCSEVWEFSKKNVVKSLSGRLKTESEVSLWLQWPRAPLCALTTWTRVLLAKPDKENIVPWNWSSKTADATPLLTESRKYICGTRRDTSYALFIFGFGKLFSMTKCSRHVCCIKKKLNTNVKWNLTICRKYKLPEANPPKAALKVEPCWRSSEVRMRTCCHQFLFYAREQANVYTKLGEPVRRQPRTIYIVFIQSQAEKWTFRSGLGLWKATCSQLNDAEGWSSWGEMEEREN